jgi:DNA-directed RNA polymerase specialized sigma24 family protein
MFVMFEIDELTCRDIADTLELPLGTVHSRLHRARESFRTAIAAVRAGKP